MQGRHGCNVLIVGLLLQQCWWPVQPWFAPSSWAAAQRPRRHRDLVPRAHDATIPMLGKQRTTITTTTTTTIPAILVDTTDAAGPGYYANVLAEEVALLDDRQKNTTRIDWALESLVSMTTTTTAVSTRTAETSTTVNKDGNNNTGQGSAPSTTTTTRTPANLRSVRGLYEVAYVKTVQAGENPVGGQWTRKGGLAQQLFRSRRSFQHILGVNETGRGRRTVFIPRQQPDTTPAPVTNRGLRSNRRRRRRQTATTSATQVSVDVLGEAVNVISLSAFCGAVRATIILRGDVIGLDPTERTLLRLPSSPSSSAAPLTSNAVRALFDPPRIVLGRTGRIVNVSLGPRTSVVLDAPYVDHQIRLGVGARSQTRFVFRRCSPSDVEANEFRELLHHHPMGRLPLVALFGGLSCVMAACRRTPVGMSLALVSFLMAALFGTTGGGIERNDRSVGDAKKLRGQ